MIGFSATTVSEGATACATAASTVGATTVSTSEIDNLLSALS
jgi:hypothetical protein